MTRVHNEMIDELLDSEHFFDLTYFEYDFVYSIAEIDGLLTEEQASKLTEIYESFD